MTVARSAKTVVKSAPRGPPGPDVDVMRRVKAQFDPRGALNLGRFVEGT